MTMTRTRSRRRALVALVMLAWYAGQAVVVAEAITPREAIERAAIDRFGAGVVQVSVGFVTTTVLAQPALVAVPDPAGYVGQAVRFALTVNGERRGTAVAAVQVRARVARAARAIERNQVIDANAIAFVEDDLKGVRFGRLPQWADLVGARARRAIAPGVVVTSGMVAIPPAVLNGDRVTVGVTIGRVHVTGEGIASGSGRVGDVVHVRQTGRRGLLKARIMERGVVEVMP
jgi:flagella basal body P-ring formation protein FlgA